MSRARVVHYATFRRKVADALRIAHPGLTFQQCDDATELVLLAIADTLAEGKALRIPNLGAIEPATNIPPADHHPPIGRVTFRPIGAIRTRIPKLSKASQS